MAFFYSFTDSLKQKWLQFFQVNRDWIKLHMEVESVYTPDGGKRPPSYLILGVANALEPKLAQLMLPFSKLNPDADTLVEVLDLNFDPDIALGNRVIPKPEESPQEDESAIVMEEISHDQTLTSQQTNDLENNAIAHDVEMGYDHEETLMVPDSMVRDELRAMSTEHLNSSNENLSSQGHNFHNESQQSSQSDAADEFGDISFDAMKEADSTISATAAPEENKFADVLSDVWSTETSSLKSESNTDFFGEELSNNGFDDSEIARLFPNT
ncbi:DUF5331 domain-containing protein [Fischerella sp. JS2]|uniref:DUF5331 domain-containing protein n=1 Tax=Fischerella sp. JS2 TaxID=2597771 RepID=UPI0028F0FD08|nr:DUF5331 domain-containing protein [Fischerella sp. JS2]